MEFILYILKCANGSLYIGHTVDLDKRLARHQLGKGSAYMAARRPLQLMHTELYESRYAALTMERKFKGWSRAEKLAFMTGDWQSVGKLAKDKHRRQR
jgi:predicted GIY-YIG superfamily endonuclease